MSLINQMLRDLDARRAPATDRPQLQSIVHAAQARRSRTRLVLALAIATLGAAAGAWYWWSNGTQRASQPVLMATAQPAPVPAASVAPLPAAPAAVATPAAVPSAVPAQPAAVPVQTAATKPAASAVSAPAAQMPPVAAKATFQPKKLAAAAALDKPVPTASNVSAPKSAPTLPSAKASAPLAGESTIEKRSPTALANEAAEIEYQKALTALRRGATAEAIASLQATLRLDMLHISARQALLSLRLRQQQWGEAQALAEEGLALDPTQTGWAITLARLQLENGKADEATETLARHARHADRNADFQAFQALLLQKQKRYKEAGERYLAAVTLRPGEARWWYGLGVSLDADQRPDEAREAFLRARDAGNLPPELAGSLKHYLR